MYLGAKLRKFTLHNGVQAWGFSPSKYVNNAIENMENYLRYKMNGLKLRIFENGGEVPETMISGETADISPFAEFGWYNWVKFRDETISFPGDREVLRRYLGPAIGVGPALTARILKRNGRVVHRSTY